MGLGGFRSVAVALMGLVFPVGAIAIFGGRI